MVFGTDKGVFDDNFELIFYNSRVNSILYFRKLYSLWESTKIYMCTYKYKTEYDT